MWALIFLKTTHLIVEERIMQPFTVFKEDECKGEWLNIGKLFDVVVVATWTSGLHFPKGPYLQYKLISHWPIPI